MIMMSVATTLCFLNINLICLMHPTINPVLIRGIRSKGDDVAECKADHKYIEFLASK